MWLIKQNIFYLLLLVILVTYLAGMFVPVMEVDAAQYASISDQLLHGNSILQIKHRDIEYLDKPPLLFWILDLGFQNYEIQNTKKIELPISKHDICSSVFDYPFADT